MSRIDDLSRLDGAELLASLNRVARDSRALTAELLAHLAVADARRLHLQEACSSLHDYCVRRLALDEETAWRYVGVARLVARFPVLLELVSGGELHVSGIRQLAPWLKDERADDGALHDLIRAACGKSRKEISAMLAERFPQRCVPSTVTPLDGEGEAGVPDGRGGSLGDSRHPGGRGTEDGATRLQGPGAPAVASLMLETLGERATAEELDRGGAPPSVSPLGARRYRVQFTASEALVAKLEEAQALLSHTVSAGDLPTLIGLALEALCQQTLKRRFGVGSRRRGKARSMIEQGLEPVDVCGDRVDQSEPVEGGELDPDPVVVGADQTDLDGSLVRGGRLDPDPVAIGGGSLEQEPRVPGGRLDPDPVDNSGGPETRGTSTEGASRTGGSTRIPLSVRAEVYLRDGGRCTFVDAAGRRCESCTFLQLDHVTMACRGGAPTVDNCRLLCGPHNRAEARQLLGDDFVAQKVRARRQEKRRSPEPPPRPVNRALLAPGSWPWDDPLLHQILDALDGQALSLEELWQTPGLAGSRLEIGSGVHALAWQERVAFLPGRRRVARTDQDQAWESSGADAHGAPVMLGRSWDEPEAPSGA